MDNNEEVLSRLKFIGHLQKGDKIDSKNINFQPPGLYTSFNRTIISDSRNNTLRFLREVFNRVYEILKHYLHSNISSEQFMCRVIISDLIKAQSGLENLKITYGNDLKFCCDIDVMLLGLISKVEEIKTVFPDLFKEDTTDSSQTRDVLVES